MQPYRPQGVQIAERTPQGLNPLTPKLPFNEALQIKRQINCGHKRQRAWLIVPNSQQIVPAPRNWNPETRQAQAADPAKLGPPLPAPSNQAQAEPFALTEKPSNSGMTMLRRICSLIGITWPAPLPAPGAQTQAKPAPTPKPDPRRRLGFPW